MSAWIEHQLGLGPDNIFPSVRFALETALLTLIASAKQTSVACLLAGSSLLAGSTSGSDAGPHSKPVRSSVQLNALIGGTSSPEEAAAAARDLVRQGFCTIKIKVTCLIQPVL